MFYDVTIQRAEYRSHTFRVEARNADEAEGVALKECGDHDFRENTVDGADECVTHVCAVPTEG